MAGDGTSYVVDKDRGYARIYRGLTDGRHNGKVRVGWFPGAGSSAGTTVAQYAMFNEFGTKSIPERPFMRRAFDRNMQKYTALFAKLEGRFFDGHITFDGILSVVGLVARNDVVQSITDARKWAVPNAPATVRQKKSSSPLIDTGTMRNTCWYEVVTKAGRRMHRG